jgi:hypothetical protein
MDRLLTFDELLQRLKDTPEQKSLLVGNGLSMSLKPEFSDFDLLRASGILQDARLQKLCDYLKTHSIENVMSMLRDLQWLTEFYQENLSLESLRGRAQQDLDRIREMFVRAVKEVHPSTAAELAEPWRTSCSHFIRRFDKIFTTNYDLLLYWVVQGFNSLYGEKGFRDGFGPVPRSELLLFQDFRAGQFLKEIWYLHGALHIFPFHGLATKTSTNGRDYLLDSIDAEMKERGLPLIVMDGSGKKKEETINGNQYLRFCRDRFKGVSGLLVSYGYGFGKADAHICDWIASNAYLSEVIVGLYLKDSFDSARIQEVFAEIQESRRLKQIAPLTINYFDTSKAFESAQLRAA